MKSESEYKTVKMSLLGQLTENHSESFIKVTKLLKKQISKTHHMTLIALGIYILYLIEKTSVSKIKSRMSICTVDEKCINLVTH